MIKVSVLYPYAPGKHFDMDYYCETHMPLVQQVLGPACKEIAVDEGTGSVAPGSPPPFAAIGHMYFDSEEAMRAAYAGHMDELAADIANFTDIQPLLQISEVKV